MATGRPLRLLNFITDRLSLSTRRGILPLIKTKVEPKINPFSPKLDSEKSEPEIEEIIESTDDLSTRTPA
ncbi:hypothetical protein TcasGA2_TC013957 [Tribolium castaneum]|uniref:Uncharacterized protein n=1 Tax=Tribolium castaneum TaxID=7070 RepID=D6WNR6_TRICA|nr:hypothetical protein TcasGA2_TC013957 [Tribolium castaneum]